jgi:hypothetical protein
MLLPEPYSATNSTRARLGAQTIAPRAGHEDHRAEVNEPVGIIFSVCRQIKELKAKLTALKQKA